MLYVCCELVVEDLVVVIEHGLCFVIVVVDLIGLIQGRN